MPACMPLIVVGSPANSPAEFSREVRGVGRRVETRPGLSFIEPLLSSFLLPCLPVGRDTSIVTVKRHFFDFKRNGSLPVGRGFVAVTLTLSRFHCSEDNVFLPGATLWKDIVSIDC